MKNTILFPPVFAALAFCVLISATEITGCSSTPAGKITQAEGVAIPAVNIAMNGWKAYVASGKATQAQINTVEAAYNDYYTAQLQVENTLLALKQGTSTNASSLYTQQTVANTAGTSLLNLVKQYQQ